MPNNIIRLQATIKKTAVSRSTIYNKLNPKNPQYDPTFPRPVRLGSRSIGFLESEIDTWIQQKANSRA